MNTIDNLLVVKVGTSTLMRKGADGSEQLDITSFERIGRQLTELQKEGTRVVLVSSAAITAGMVETGLTARPSKNTDMPELQRLASIGWRQVLNAWSGALGGQAVGELLLTRHELNAASERSEALHVIQSLLSHGDIAVVNENDTITHEEIAFGDNDALAAILAAQLKQSELFGHNIKLIILSDVDGVYGQKDDTSSVIGVIEDMTRYKYLAGGAGSSNGTGGMAAKFAAAIIATGGGVEMLIANGRREGVIKRALNGESGTRFTVA